MVLPGTATIGDLVKVLNAVGATPRDIIAILQAIKEAGALYGELGDHLAGSYRKEAPGVPLEFRAPIDQ